MRNPLINLFRRCEGSDHSPIDVSQFEDEIAAITDWEPLNTATSNFNTRKLECVNDQLLQYKTTTGLKLFSGVFIVTGILFLLFIGPRQFDRWVPVSWEEVLAQLACFFFVAFGIAMLYFGSPPVIFDRGKMVFIKGRRYKRINITFAEIYALQLIPQYASSMDGPDYYNYQLNIVLCDGMRVHVVNYYNAKKARTDAKAISLLTGKPVWDISKHIGQEF